MDEEKNQTTTSEGTQETTGTEEAIVATGEETEAQKGTVEVEGEKKETQLTKESLEKAVEQAKATVKGGYEGTVKKMREDNVKLQQDHANVLAQLEELRQTQFLRDVEAQGGNLDAAKQLVERQRNVTAQERQLNTLAAQMAVTQAELDQAAIGKKLSDLMKEHNLPKEAEIELMTAQSPVEMENKALKLALKQNKVEKKKPEKIATEVSSGQGGVDLSKLSDREKLAKALAGEI